MQIVGAILALFLTAACQPVPSTPAIPYGPPSVVGPTVAYVLLHGHGATAAAMDPLADALEAQGAAVISVDWRPVGLAAALTMIRAGIAQAHALAPRVVLVGFSMGGYLAVLASHTMRVDAVVGIEGAYEMHDARVGPLLRGLLGPVYNDPANDVLRLGAPPVPLTIIEARHDDEVYPYTAQALSLVTGVPVQWVPGSSHVDPVNPATAAGAAVVAILDGLGVVARPAFQHRAE